MPTVALLRSINRHFIQNLPWKTHTLHFEDLTMFLVQVLGRNVISEDPPVVQHGRMWDLSRISVWHVRVDVTLLVEQRANSLPIAKHNDIRRPKPE